MCRKEGEDDDATQSQVDNSNRFLFIYSRDAFFRARQNGRVLLLPLYAARFYRFLKSRDNERY
jgi:hypothetical protein